MRYLLDETEVGSKISKVEKRVNRAKTPKQRIYWTACLNTLQAVFCEPDDVYKNDSFSGQLERGAMAIGVFGDGEAE